MKKMNKVAAAVLAVAMVGSMAVPAFAADTTSAIEGTSAASTTGNTTVKYQVTEGYTWTIHSAIDFGKDRTALSDTDTKVTVGTATDSAKTMVNGNNKVSVTKNVIPTGKKLQITIKGNNGGDAETVSGDGAFVIKEAANNATLNYTVTSTAIGTNGNTATNVDSGKTVLEVPAGTDKKETTMEFTLNTTTNASEFAGSYVGKVIYTAAVVD